MCRVGTCCGCCGVEKGAKITAVLYLVLGGLGLIGAIAAGDPLLGVDAAISVGLGALLYVGAAKRNRVMVQVFLVVTVIFLVLMAVAAVLLVAGASVVSSVAIRGVAENEDVDEGQRAAAAGAAAGIVLFFAMVIFAAIAVDVYCWVVVYSFYQELKEGNLSPV